MGFASGGAVWIPQIGDFRPGPDLKDLAARCAQEAILRAAKSCQTLGWSLESVEHGHDMALEMVYEA